MTFSPLHPTKVFLPNTSVSTVDRRPEAAHQQPSRVGDVQRSLLGLCHILFSAPARLRVISSARRFAMALSSFDNALLQVFTSLLIDWFRISQNLALCPVCTNVRRLKQHTPARQSLYLCKVGVTVKGDGQCPV